MLILFVRRWMRAKPILPQPDSPLLALPDELLLLIASFSDDVGTACLSLCCRELRSRLPDAAGKLSRRLPPQPEDEQTTEYAALRRERNVFLDCIVNGFPKYFACHYCSALHRASMVRSPRTNERRLGWRIKRPACNGHLANRRDAPGILFWLPDADSLDNAFPIRLMHVQQVMARYRHGPPHGIPIDSLATTEISTRGRLIRLVLLSVQPMINADSLHFRIQHVVVSNEKSTGFKDLLGHLQGACSHISPLSLKGKAGTDAWKALLDCRTNHGEQTTGCPTCFPVLRCRKCETVFQMQTGRSRDGSRCCVLTKWVDLGPGSSDPEDERWRRHIRGSFSSARTDHLNSPLTVAEGCADIRQSFEDAAARSVEDLTNYHLDLIESGRWRWTFYFDGPRWFWSSKRWQGRCLVPPPPG